MRTKLKLLALSVVCAFLAGCAGMKSGLVLDTVGPIPGSSAPSTTGQGTLIVYSAYQVNANFESQNPTRRQHSDYKLLDQDKKPLERIHNVTGDIIQDALPVNLAPGKYFVVARSNGYGIVTVPVIIAADRKTVLHLDNGNRWPNGTAIDASDAVQLPDGEIVGWRDTSP